MKPLNPYHHRREPLKNAIDRPYRVKKTISRDGSSQEEHLNRKLYIFRIQERIREKSSRKSTLNSSRSSAASSRDAISAHDPTETRPDFESNSRRQIVDEAMEELKGEKQETVAASGVQAIGAALAGDVPEQREKGTIEEQSSEALGASHSQNAPTQMKTTSRKWDEALRTSPPPKKKKPIKFKDCVGRKFSFPFDVCNTWPKMKELLRQAFMNIEVIGPHVDMGHYDLVGPNGNIILPDQWETVLEPEWTVSMLMWPIPEKPVKPNESNNATLPSSSSPKEAATGFELNNSINELQATSKSRSTFPSRMMGVRPQPKLMLPTQTGKVRKQREDLGIKEANKIRRKKNFKERPTF